MVKKPRSREDHRGWFSILRRGKKSFIEALQNQEKERNPLETDNEDRCNMIAWEAIQHYFTSSQFTMMYRRDFNTYDRDLFRKRVHIIKVRWFKEILDTFWEGTAAIPSMGDSAWKSAESELFNSTHQTNTFALKQLLNNLESFLDNLEFKDNYFTNVKQWLDACETGGPLASSVDLLNHKHNKWYVLKQDRKTNSSKPQEDKQKIKDNNMRKPGETHVDTWEEWNELFDKLVLSSKYKRNKDDKYRSPGSMNK